MSAGQADLVTITGRSFATNFLTFLDRLEYRILLDLDGQGFLRVMIPIARRHLTYQPKILREIALLQLIIYTTAQRRSTSYQRRNLAGEPTHKKILADAIDKLTAEELALLLNGTARRLVAHRVFATSNGRIAPNASDLTAPPTYTGSGMVTEVHQKLTNDKRLVEIEEYLSGFQVFAAYESQSRLIVAAKVVLIQECETRHTIDLLRQAIRNLGPKILRILLVDWGFPHGADVWTLKHTLSIDFVVPSKAKMHITPNAQALTWQETDGENIFQAHRASVHNPTIDGPD